MTELGVTEDLVEKAQAAWTKAYWAERTPGKNDWMREALAAVVPEVQALTRRAVAEEMAAHRMASGGTAWKDA